MNKVNWPANSSATASIPPRASRRLKMLSALLRPGPSVAGMRDKVSHCQTNVTAASGTTTEKAPRQPIYRPRKLPSGAATIVARALPRLSTARARGTWSTGTSRITFTADIDQKPPMTIPIKARPAISTR